MLTIIKGGFMPNLNCNGCSGTFTDGRDGQVYGTAEMSEEEYETLLENLKGKYTELSNTVKDIADTFDEIFQIIDSEDKNETDKP
jgi:hypothetical protein